MESVRNMQISRYCQWHSPVLIWKRRPLLSYKKIFSQSFIWIEIEFRKDTLEQFFPFFFVITSSIKRKLSFFSDRKKNCYKLLNPRFFCKQNFLLFFFFLFLLDFFSESIFAGDWKEDRGRETCSWRRILIYLLNFQLEWMLCLLNFSSPKL